MILRKMSGSLERASSNPTVEFGDCMAIVSKVVYDMAAEDPSGGVVRTGWGIRCLTRGQAGDFRVCTPCL